MWVGEDFGGGFLFVRRAIFIYSIFLLTYIHIRLYILINCLCFNLALFVRRALYASYTIYEDIAHT